MTHLFNDPVARNWVGVPCDEHEPPPPRYTNEYHELAKLKGFHDEDEWKDGKPTPRQLLAWSALLCSEFFEWRGEKDLWYLSPEPGNEGKPEGTLAELADVWIRCQDLGGALGIEIVPATKEESSLLSYPVLCSRLIESARKQNLDEFVRALRDMCGFCREQARLEIKTWGDEGIPDTFDEAVRLKHEFNKTRPFRHGKKA